MFAGQHTASAEQPPSGREQTIANELAEVKQTLQALSLHVDTLQRELNGAVTSSQQADQQQLFDAAYNVSDLVPEWRGDFAVAWNPKPLVRYITKHIAPQQWEEAGGEGIIRVYDADRSLVITQTAEVHQELQQWFQRLRETKAVLAEVAGFITPPPAKVFEPVL